jgi:hypothetical protein
MYREAALDAYAVGNPADRKSLINPAAAALDDDSFKSLHSFLGSFDNLDKYFYRIAGPEFRYILTNMTDLDTSQQIHDKSSF